MLTQITVGYATVAHVLPESMEHIRIVLIAPLERTQVHLVLPRVKPAPLEHTRTLLVLPPVMGYGHLRVVIN